MDILETIRCCGIVGCGGAGFPTARKLDGKIEYFIVNGAECEPLLRTDRYLMREKAHQLVSVVMTLKQELNIPHCVFALKGHYEEEVTALRAAIRAAGADISVHELESFYPAGDEQTIVYEVTGRVVPPAGLPSAVGAVVDNVATVYAVSEALEGRPFTQKYLTVTGEVRRPSVLRVPIGTPLSVCIEAAGGAKSENFYLMTGGPMMGRPVPHEGVETAVVGKTTSGILVLPADGYHAQKNGVDVAHMINRARTACIQCSSCTQLCPRHLLGHPLQPHRIMRKLAMGDSITSMLDDPDILNAQLCCECGICESYACPMGLQPRRINAIVKQELARAGIRYHTSQIDWHPLEERALRKTPSERIAARVGVHAYYDYEIRDLTCPEVRHVEIPLKMHIGASAVPCVQVGERVHIGDLIAAVPDGALGANVHASIDGCVESVGERIVIAAE